MWKSSSKCSFSDIKLLYHTIGNSSSAYMSILKNRLTVWTFGIHYTHYKRFLVDKYGVAYFLTHFNMHKFLENQVWIPRNVSLLVLRITSYLKSTHLVYMHVCYFSSPSEMMVYNSPTVSLSFPIFSHLLFLIFCSNFSDGWPFLFKFCILLF